jgi:hypothetical protein
VTPQLDYQPDAPAQRRKRRRRRVLLVALVLGFAGLAVWLGPSTYRAVLRTYWERRVKAYTAPPDRVVYEEDPSRWPVLLAQPGYRKMTAGSPGWQDFVAYLATPVTSFSKASGVRAGGTALFAHSRRAPAGRERLVVVWLAYNGIRPNESGSGPEGQVRLALCTTVVTGSKRREGIVHVFIAPKSVAEHRRSPPYARIYAGQLDLNDASHFTIPFQIGDYEDVLDGYLRDDETVLIRPRKLDHPLNPK